LAASAPVYRSAAPPGRQRALLLLGLLLLTAVALAAATVAAAGTIGFVGLIAPHLGRRLVGPDHGGLLPTAGLLGALLVVAADLVGRTVAAPIELPAGLITAAIGAPFFIALLWRQRKG
jgi:iron complex transport system permease protein